MLLLELTRRFIQQVFPSGFADWLRISLIGLVSVVLVFLVAQWTALLGVVLTLNRAHVTETDGDDHSPTGSVNNRRRLQVSRAPPMYGPMFGATGQNFESAPVSEDFSGWDLRRPPPPRPIPPPPIKTPQTEVGVSAPFLPPAPDLRASSAGSGLSLVDLNFLTESTRLSWRPNPYPSGMLATRCTCGITSWWRWSTSEGNEPASGGHDPPLLIINKSSGVP